jgi:hypothetical protein
MSRGPLTNQEIRSVLRRVLDGEHRQDVAARFGIARSTVDRYCQRAEIHLMRRRNRGTDDSWMQQAACRHDYDFTEWSVLSQKAVCKNCPVRKRCLEFGLRHPTGWTKANEGPVYGGLSPMELEQLRRRLRQPS